MSSLYAQFMANTQAATAELVRPVHHLTVVQILKEFNKKVQETGPNSASFTKECQRQNMKSWLERLNDSSRCTCLPSLCALMFGMDAR